MAKFEIIFSVILKGKSKNFNTDKIKIKLDGSSEFGVKVKLEKLVKSKIYSKVLHYEGQPIEYKICFNGVKVFSTPTIKMNVKFDTLGELQIKINKFIKDKVTIEIYSCDLVNYADKLIDLGNELFGDNIEFKNLLDILK